MWSGTIPNFGYIRLTWWDSGYITFSVGLIVLGGWSVITAPTLLVLVIGLLQFGCGAAALVVTGVHARFRAACDRRVNPIAQLEAIRSHAIAEGHIHPPLET